MKCKVVNMYDSNYDLDITRRSTWGNPFKIGVHGNREQVIAKHRALILAQPKLMQTIRDKMQGKRLGCVCAPQACHGDVYAQIANGEL